MDQVEPHKPRVRDLLHSRTWANSPERRGWPTLKVRMLRLSSKRARLVTPPRSQRGEESDIGAENWNAVKNRRDF